MKSTREECVCWKHSYRKQLKTNSEWPQSGPLTTLQSISGKQIQRGILQLASRVEPRILRPMHLLMRGIFLCTRSHKENSVCRRMRAAQRAGMFSCFLRPVSFDPGRHRGRTLRRPRRIPGHARIFTGIHSRTWCNSRDRSVRRGDAETERRGLPAGKDARFAPVRLAVLSVRSAGRRGLQRAGEPHLPVHLPENSPAGEAGGYHGVPLDHLHGAAHPLHRDLLHGASACMAGKPRKRASLPDL